MLKKAPAKALALLLAMIMVIVSMPITVFASGSVTNYADFLAHFKQLEVYADEYAAQSSRTVGELVLNFIRTGVERYQDDSWETLAGEEITGFTAYVEEQDALNGTAVMNLRDIVIDDFTLPNGNPSDFGHMFGCMNISYVAAAVQSDDLSGWAGDLCDLLQYSALHTTVPEGTMDEMAAYILENCFGVNASEAYGWDDFYGDMDAYYLIREYEMGNGSFSELMEAYFTAELDDVARAVYFLNNRFPGQVTREGLRTAMYNAYRTNVGLQVLEAKRGLSDENTLRQACCYAFADYLFSKAEGLLAGGDAGDDDEGEELPDNGYYSVFSTTSSVLAPGVTQDIKYAMSADGKQMVYYVATVDVTRDDLTIMANYKDNDPSKGWGMQRVEDQINALVKNHQDIENFTPVVAINGDGFNTSTGEPGGLLVMEGVEWHPVDGDGFFAILKDGSAMIGSKADYYTYKDQIQEAIGAFGSGRLLVEDGQLVPLGGGTRASRTAVGVKADGSVVMMVMDGRQEPFSCGGTLSEIAQVMLDAGCVTAVNLDGGGSTTYMAKPEGSDTIQVVNRPSDGYARSLATSLVAISTAKSSKEFDRAIIQTEYDHLTIGTALQLTAVGVNNIGSSAVIPEGTYWVVSDESVGTVSADGVFTAAANGDVEVYLMLDGAAVGSIALHVVVPDTLEFTEKTLNLTYGVRTRLPLEAYYNGNPVAMNADDIFTGYLEEDPEAEAETGPRALFDGFYVTAQEKSGARNMTAFAIVLENEDAYCEMRVSMFKEGESVFDFDQATAGNRQLAWIRNVKNTVTGDRVNYTIVDPNEDIELEYTFALDMTTIEIPARLQDIVHMLPGSDVEGTTAFSYLLRLAERVSVLTSVTITAQFDLDLDIDISDLKIINDYFELSEASVDANNFFTMKCTWIDQTQALDEVTANPLCIMTGIKATPKEGAAWSGDELLITNSGHVSYDIYLRASSLYSFALRPENQAQYGLIPYTADDTGWEGGTETGAHYTDTYLDFDEGFIIDRTVRQGWYKEDGEYVYYRNHKRVTGMQYVPSREDAAVSLFYEFDADGVCIGKVSGLVHYGDVLYYAVNGEMTTGWVSGYDADGNAVDYYFDPATGKAVDGQQKIDGYNYTFTDHILTRGDLVTDAEGTRYRWAGAWVHGKWFQVDGNWYATKKYVEYVVSGGLLYVPGRDSADWFMYLFDENGVFMEHYTGLYEQNGNIHYVVNGEPCPTSKLVYEGGYYYYVSGAEAKVYRNCTMWVSRTNGLMPAGNYTFDEQGRMVNPPAVEPPQPDQPDEQIKNGIVEENGALYYYVDDVMQSGNGLVKLTDDNGADCYIYVRNDGRLAVGTYWITITNGLLEKGKLVFGADGKYYPPAQPEAPADPAPAQKNGVVQDEDGVWRYYVDGVLQRDLGVVKLTDENGLCYYIYVRANGHLATGMYWPTVRNGLMPRGSYDWGTDGRYYPAG